LVGVLIEGMNHDVTRELDRIPKMRKCQDGPVVTAEEPGAGDPVARISSFPMNITESVCDLADRFAFGRLQTEHALAGREDTPGNEDSETHDERQICFAKHHDPLR